jgi:acyl dehydratase
MPDYLYFEDFQTGQTFDYGAYRVTRDEIIAFAREYDPQPQHLDEEAAKQTLLGKLCASGWHTAAMLMRINVDGMLGRSAGLGAPGIEEVRWIKPVLPGDVLSAHTVIGKTRASASRPDMGLVELTFTVRNGAGEDVMEQRNFVMFGRRGMKPPGPAQTVAATQAAPPPQPLATSAPDLAAAAAILGYLEDITMGETLPVGSYAFTRENVLAFARAYDPQPFHLDDEAAARSPFGRLAASGWHTASAFMKCMIATRDAAMQVAQARGEALPPRGPSPGFRELRWLRPVYPGDVIAYSTTPLEKRATSRPGWGLLSTQAVGVNQDGVRVYEYKGSSFRPMRG